MIDLDSVARNAVEVSLNAIPGERILIQGWDHTIDLMSRLAWQSRKSGCHVLLSIQPEDLWLRSIIEAPTSLLERPPDHLLAALETSQVFVFTLGPRNPVPWKEIPEARRKAVSIWLDTRYDKSSFAAEWVKTARRRNVRMLGIEATLATPERAKAMNLDYAEWTEVMFAGCLANGQQMSRRARRLARFLSGSDTVRITTPHGTDMQLALDQRPVEYSDGLTNDEKTKKGLVTFLPSGDAQVSVDEETAEGRIVYDLPIRAGGQVVRKLTMKVERGRVVEFAAEGRDAFKEYLTGGGDVNRLGFFGFGLNPKLRFGYTQDDKVLGGVTIGLGDNESKGGQNRAGGQEWWGCVSKATVTIGGTKIMNRGGFVV